MVYQYEWSGYKYNVSAETVGGICEQIEERDGCVTNASLLDEAKSEASPIHSLYEWDNSIAGEKWRLHQSSRILSALKVTVKSDGAEPKPVKAFINTNPVNTEGAFKMTVKAMRDAETRGNILLRALRELGALREKYETLTELEGIWRAINEAEETFM